MAQAFIPHSKAISRFKEPSTWAGIAALLLAFNQVTPSEAETVITGGSAIAGLLAMFMREKK